MQRRLAASTAETLASRTASPPMSLKLVEQQCLMDALSCQRHWQWGQEPEPCFPLDLELNNDDDTASILF